MITRNLRKQKRQSRIDPAFVFLKLYFDLLPKLPLESPKTEQTATKKNQGGRFRYRSTGLRFNKSNSECGTMIGGWSVRAPAERPGTSGVLQWKRSASGQGGCHESLLILTEMSPNRNNHRNYSPYRFRDCTSFF
jgi:hypothetical protein